MCDPPLSELIYFFICDVPKQDLWLVDVVAGRYDAAQRIALLQEAVCQVQRLSRDIQLLLHLHHATHSFTHTHIGTDRHRHRYTNGQWYNCTKACTAS